MENRQGQAAQTVADMMRAREARAAMQHALLTKYPGTCVVCLCMNIAGPVKTDAAIERAFAWGVQAVRDVLAPHELCYDAQVHEATGPEAMFCVRAQALELKRRLCLLEDGDALGRLLDIDVIAPDGDKVARTALGLPARRCLLCGEPAPVCARSRAHSVDALFARAHELIDAHFEQAFVRRTAQNAVRALLCEVAVTPKPGLVDRANAGAHTDMDVFTFIDSACALAPYFESCACTGLAFRQGNPEACFDALRTPGLLAEAAMRRATGGVNTHKGAIFSLGIACAALGMGYEAAPGLGKSEACQSGEGQSSGKDDDGRADVAAALLRCGEMTRGPVQREFERMDGGKGCTAGERLYCAQGVGGVRAEAAGGFASVREAALPRLEACLAAGLNLNDASLCALVALMARTQDTNALHRGGAEGARAMQQTAQEIDRFIVEALSCGKLPGMMGQVTERMRAWDEALSRARISPGGSADLLALALLMHFASQGE